MNSNNVKHFRGLNGKGQKAKRKHRFSNGKKWKSKFEPHARSGRCSTSAQTNVDHVPKLCRHQEIGDASAGEGYYDGQLETGRGQKRPRNDAYHPNAKKPNHCQNAGSDGPSNYKPENDDGGSVFLDINVLNYVRHAVAIIEDGFQKDDDKELFVAKFLETIERNEAEVACHRIASRVLDKVLPLCTCTQLTQFTGKICCRFSYIFKHACGTHMLQVLLIAINNQLCSLELSSSKSKNQVSPLKKFINQLVVFLCTNIGEAIKCQASSHVIISLLEILSRVKLPDSLQSCHQFMADGRLSNDIQEEFSLCLTKLVNVVATTTRFKGLCGVVYTVVLQAVLLVLSKVDKVRCAKFVRETLWFLRKTEPHYYMLCFENVKNEGMIRVLERVIEVSTPTVFERLVKEHFCGRLRCWASHLKGNYVVQRLLTSCTTSLLFEKIYSELEDTWCDIFANGFLGIMTAMSEACIRLGACQDRFTGNLAKLFEYDKQRFTSAGICFAQLVAYMKTPGEWIGLSDKSRCVVNYHGSLLIQNMLLFQEPSLIVNSLIAVSPSELLQLFCNVNGSHILDTFLNSERVSSKARHDLTGRLKGHFLSLACDKYGSQCLETCFQAVDMNCRLSIVGELSLGVDQLKRDRFGLIVAINFKVDMFKVHPKAWNQRFSKRRPFDDDVLRILER